MSVLLSTSFLLLSLTNGLKSGIPSRRAVQLNSQHPVVMQSTRMFPSSQNLQQEMKSRRQPVIIDFHPKSFRFPSSMKETHDDFLDYLPWYVLQDETKECVNLITRATRRYIYGDTRGDSPLTVADTLRVIHSEYKSSHVPIVINSRRYAGTDPLHREVIQILSFAAYHRLPTPITAVLLEDRKDFQQQFLDSGGWLNVSFPRGLGIRLPRNRLTQVLHRYQPIPRRFLASRNMRFANRCIREAAKVQAPPRQLLSHKGFLESLQREIQSSQIRHSWKDKIKGVSLPFFPTKRTMFSRFHKKIREIVLNVRTMSTRTTYYTMGTVLLYGITTFIYYNACLLSKWHQLPSNFGFSSFAFLSSLFRIGSVLSRVVSEFHIILPLLCLAVLSSPLATGTMPTIRKLFDVSKDYQALVMVGLSLSIVQFGFLLSLLLLDVMTIRPLLI
jgi:hypothetical protein